MIEIITGIISSLAIIILVSVVSKHVAVNLIAATILCAIAFIYVGFALVENVIPNIILEVSVSLFFYFVAIIGYSKNTHFIAYGIMLHGLWDLFHLSEIGTDIPAYWPAYCSTADLILGIYFIWHKGVSAVNVKNAN